MINYSHHLLDIEQLVGNMSLGFNTFLFLYQLKPERGADDDLGTSGPAFPSWLAPRREIPAVFPKSDKQDRTENPVTLRF